MLQSQGELALQAMKRRWEERRKKEGKSTDKPNLVMGNNVQVVCFPAVDSPLDAFLCGRLTLHAWKEIGATAAVCTHTSEALSPPQKHSSEQSVSAAVLGESHKLHVHRGKVCQIDRQSVRGNA